MYNRAHIFSRFNSLAVSAGEATEVEPSFTPDTAGLKHAIDGQKRDAHAHGRSGNNLVRNIAGIANRWVAAFRGQILRKSGRRHLCGFWTLGRRFLTIDFLEFLS
jgi:hypothetical protein